MMELKTHEHHHRNDPGTSKAAAEKMIKSGKMSRQCQEVYDSFLNFAPTTSKALSAISGLDYHMIARRFADLVKSGHIVDTGEKENGCRIMGLAEQQGRLFG
ncbi:MAG: hypothetical protein GY861_14535 [bacterium]|nr:hypothetical protein [bacterium]